MNDRSVYLSYHRSFSGTIARALFHALRARGCEVFMDLGPLDRRDAADLAQIEAHSHFLIVIAPGLIEALQKPDDPMQREVERAISTRRGIVPLLANGFSFSAPFLPHALGLLRRYYALTLAPETLADAVTALCDRHLNDSIFGALMPTPREYQSEVRQRIAEAERQPAPTEAELRAEVLFNRGFGRSRQDHAGKLADFDEVLRLNPGHVYARFERALARRRSGDEMGAVEDYDEVLRLNPQFYSAYSNRAELYFARSFYRRALADYEQAAALRPNYTMALAGKALALHALGHVDEALRLWKPLVAQDQRFYDAVWVGRELRLPATMIDEMHRLTLRLYGLPRVSDT